MENFAPDLQQPGTSITDWYSNSGLYQSIRSVALISFWTNVQTFWQLFYCTCIISLTIYILPFINFRCWYRAPRDFLSKQNDKINFSSHYSNATALDVLRPLTCQKSWRKGHWYFSRKNNPRSWKYVTKAERPVSNFRGQTRQLGRYPEKSLWFLVLKILRWHHCVKCMIR